MCSPSSKSCLGVRKNANFVGLTWDACPLKPSRWPATSGAEVKPQLFGKTNVTCIAADQRPVGSDQVILYELDLGQAPQWWLFFSKSLNCELTEFRTTNEESFLSQALKNQGMNMNHVNLHFWKGNRVATCVPVKVPDTTNDCRWRGLAPLTLAVSRSRSVLEL